MDRFLKFIGFITCIVGIIYGASWLMQHFSKYVEPTLQGLGVLALLVLFVRLYLGRDWLMKLGQEFIVGSDLIKASENFLNDLPKPKNETTANFIGHLVYRFTRLGLIGLMLALIPITLLYQQNQLLSKQNERFDIQNDLITKQNKRLDQQTYLQEAERRSSLVFLFSNIMDAIDDELKDDYGNDDIRNLSPQLIGRIAGLSTRLKPYRYLDGDTLTSKPISPERGQLLVSLHGSELDTLTMKQICSRADFSYAHLIGANLENADLRNVGLMEADLNDADLSYADLDDAILFGTNLSDANLSRADLRKVQLREADLNGTDLRSANLIHANLVDANLTDAELDNADLRNAGLRGADLNGTDLSEVDLRGANLWYANFTGEVNLKNARVNGDFFQITQQYKKRDTISNTDYILENYEIDSISRNNQWRYYLTPKN